MFDKLDFILEKYEELSLKVSDPDIISNQPVWKKHMKELGELEPIALKYKEYKKAKEEMDAAREMLDSDDEEMKELAKMEMADLEDKIPEIENDLKILMLPKDPNDDKNVILEVRAGTGGDEAALFGMDLLRMYLRYAERRGWKAEVIDANETDIGGVKEAEVMIKGKGAYSRLKYESGTHRVHRVLRTYPHFSCHHRRASRSRRRGSNHRSQRHQSRRIPFIRSRWTVRKYHRLRSAYHPSSHGTCGHLPGRKVPDKE